jgi:hypothetical protein
MQGLVRELLSTLNITNEYEYTNLSGKAVYLSGQQGILDFNSSTITFKLNGEKTFVIIGENLIINELNKDEAIITGKIISLEVK